MFRRTKLGFGKTTLKFVKGATIVKQIKKSGEIAYIGPLCGQPVPFIRKSTRAACILLCLKHPLNCTYVVHRLLSL